MRVTDRDSTGNDGLDREIFSYQGALSSLPRSRQSTQLLLHVAMGRLQSFHLSDNEQDLQTSILQFTLAIFLPFGGHHSTEDGTNIISTFFFLTKALLHRSRVYRQPGDVELCIKFLHFLRDSPHKAPGVTHSILTTSLVHSLVLQVELEPENATQGVEVLEEMSGLCGELFTLDISKQDLKRIINNFAEAVLSRVVALWNPPSERVIALLQEANRRLPDLHRVPYVLCNAYIIRFQTGKKVNEYWNAMNILDEILASRPPTDGCSQNLEFALRASARLARHGFMLYGDLAYLEQAIVRYRAYLDSISLEDPQRGGILLTLLELERKRSEEFTDMTNGHPGARSDHLEDVDLHSFLQLASSFVESNAHKSHSMTVIMDRIRHFQAVYQMTLLTNEADIEGAAEHCRLLLTSLQQSPNDDITIFTLRTSGDFFRHAFELTANPEYLNKAIDVYRDILEVPSAQWTHFSVIKRLISSLLHRLNCFHDGTAFGEIMQLLDNATTNTFAKISIRFRTSCDWARIARDSRHPSLATAYKNAISLMQDFLTFVPTVEMQHSRLVSMREDIEKLPLDYASYQIHIGQLEEAVETLERGRGLLWSELRGLRTSIDQLCRADISLAEKFAAINQDLEELTTSISTGRAQTSWSNGGDTDSGEEMDLFGRIVVKQRKLLAERTRLITQIRSLPNFETFLMPSSFETLRSAASHGPVIIINYCHWRSDIVILLRDSPPSLIPTSNNFYDRAKGLNEQLLGTRRRGLDSGEYKDALIYVLEMLYELVGRPVVQRLQELKIPEQSRIWWCPTSIFCSLPLHAMGPIRSEGPHKLYFSDLYISSYTPTLSALIESHKAGSHSFEEPSILLVAQLDLHMPAVREEISHIRRLKTKVITLISKRATPSAVMGHLQNHRFAHFACHGRLETGRPFDACFNLYQGERLTLLEIIRSQLPSAEFAFLSACHTAALTKESIANEGLHLSAAVQYSGFRSVVGTMWAMADIDGAFLAKHFYKSLFSERQQGMPYYERTAEALRDAVKKLRLERNVAIERWVNFIHYGA